MPREIGSPAEARNLNSCNSVLDQIPGKRPKYYLSSIMNSTEFLHAIISQSAARNWSGSRGIETKTGHFDAGWQRFTRIVQPPAWTRTT